MTKKTNKESERFALGVMSNLHGARLKQKITQDALAKKAGVDRKTINRIENGWFSPSMDTFFRVCGALGVKPVDVLKQANKVKK